MLREGEAEREQGEGGYAGRGGGLQPRRGGTLNTKTLIPSQTGL